MSSNYRRIKRINSTGKVNKMPYSIRSNYIKLSNFMFLK